MSSTTPNDPGSSWPPEGALLSLCTGGTGTVWYRFLGPPGATFDFGPEGTFTLTSDNSFGSGKGVAMTHDISGEFQAEAAMVGADGKHGPVTVSNSVPANYTCGSGKDIATAVGAAAPPRSSSRPDTSPHGPREARDSPKSAWRK